MTMPKRPLPSLRFVITCSDGFKIRLIPLTDAKGRVLANRWAVPGSKPASTEEMIERCRQMNWSYKIEGNDGRRRRGDE